VPQPNAAPRTPTDKAGTLIILVIIYNTAKQNGILDLGFPVSISCFCVHVTPIYGRFFATQDSVNISYIVKCKTIHKG
jgi:hypothetical protein